MKDISNAQYFYRGKVNWKACLILIFSISLLWAIILFIPRPGNTEKNKYFYLLLCIGAGLDLLILYICSLRQWSKTWIKDDVIHSDIAFGLFPLSKKMSLNEVKEVCFVYNGSISRKKTAFPNSIEINQIKEKIAEKIDAGFITRKLLSATSVEDERYYLPVHCGCLYLKGDADAVISVRLNVVLNRANFQEVKKFLSFLPEKALYKWRFGKINVHTIGTSY